MVKSVVVGLLSFFVIMVLFGFVIGRYAPADVVGLGELGWREQHDQLVAFSAVKTLTVLGWFVGPCIGGVVSGLLSPSRNLRASAYIGGVIILLWAVPTTIIAGSTAGWVHIASVIAVLPGALAGGFLATGIRKT